MSQESIKNLHTSNINFSPELIDNYKRFGRVKLKGNFFLQKNVIIFSVDNISYVHIDGRNINILVYGEGPKQGLDNLQYQQKLNIL